MRGATPIATCTVCLLAIPKSRHGRIVGHGGSTVKQISTVHGVAITVPKRSDASNVVSIRGADPESVARARADIDHASGVRSGEPTSDPIMRHRVAVPTERRGLVIGRGGAVMEKIKRECGVLMHLPGRDDPEPSVVLEGVAAACNAAQVLIEKILADTGEIRAQRSRREEASMEALPPPPLLNELLAMVEHARREGFAAAATSMPDRATIDRTSTQLLASGKDRGFVVAEFRRHLAELCGRFGATTALLPPTPMMPSLPPFGTLPPGAGAGAPARPMMPSLPPFGTLPPGAGAGAGAPARPMMPALPPYGVVPPAQQQEQAAGVTIVLDGANIAVAHARGDRRSIDGIAIAARFFRTQANVGRVVAFVPQHWAERGALAASRGGELLRSMMADGTVVATPSQADDDVFFIEYARRRGSDGFIVTNDMLRDHIASAQTQRTDRGGMTSDGGRRERGLRDWCSTQLVSFTFVGDEFLPNVAAPLFRRLTALRTESEHAMEM